MYNPVQSVVFLLFFFSFSSVAIVSSTPLIHKSSLIHSKQQQQHKKIMSMESSSSSSSLYLKGGYALRSKGGDKVNQSSVPTTTVVKHSFGTIAWATWGVLQVVLVLGNAIKRLWPIAIQPFAQKDFSLYHWGAYVAWALFMMKTEGYDAFQQKFSPLVVKRAFGLNDNRSILRCLLAGPYSMGLFGATKKRMIVSWAVSIGVGVLIAVVKRLPYPYRSIIDAGVVAGLSYGTLATLVIYLKALLFGHEPSVDPCLPTNKKAE